MNVSRRVKIIIGAVVAVPVLLHLLYAVWVSPLTSYYVTVSELYGSSSLAEGKARTAGAVRIGGEVMAGSISWDGARSELVFVLTDGMRQLPAIYPGRAPDTFRAEMTAILEGRLDSEGRFRAYKLLLKCPHKYVTG
jgi:cytochrome c-type biogenesis protein CcmE